LPFHLYWLFAEVDAISFAARLSRDAFSSGRSLAHGALVHAASLNNRDDGGRVSK